MHGDNTLQNQGSLLQDAVYMQKTKDQYVVLCL